MFIVLLEKRHKVGLVCIYEKYYIWSDSQKSPIEDTIGMLTLGMK